MLKMFVDKFNTGHVKSTAAPGAESVIWKQSKHISGRMLAFFKHRIYQVIK